MVAHLVYLFFRSKGIVPIISAATRAAAVFTNAMWRMLVKKYSIGSASNLILIPGIAKQITRYVATKTITNTNNAIDVFFIYSLAFVKS